jgi:hypothetical protein
VSAIIVSSRARLRSEEIIGDSGVAGALGEFPQLEELGQDPVDAFEQIRRPGHGTSL